MDTDVRERTLTYLNARHQHPAWLLLASQRAPLVLSCLQTLFDQGRDGVALEDALRALADMLEQYAHNTDLAIENADFYNQARRELRTWIKRALVVEREGRLYPTDALEEAPRFVAALGERIMTSTASRLSIDDGQRAYLAPVRELIGDKVHSPDFIRSSCRRFLLSMHRRYMPPRTLAAQSQVLLAIHAIEAIFADPPAWPPNGKDAREAALGRAVPRAP